MVKIWVLRYSQNWVGIRLGYIFNEPAIDIVEVDSVVDVDCWWGNILGFIFLGVLVKDGDGIVPN